MQPFGFDFNEVAGQQKQDAHAFAVPGPCAQAAAGLCGETQQSSRLLFDFPSAFTVLRQPEHLPFSCRGLTNFANGLLHLSLPSQRLKQTSTAAAQCRLTFDMRGPQKAQPFVGPLDGRVRRHGAWHDELVKNEFGTKYVEVPQPRM